MSIQTDVDISGTAAGLKALGDPVRLRLLQELAGRPGGESCVCDLLELFDLSQPTISHHLKVLRGAGLVVSERRGTWMYYRVVTDAVRQLSDALRAMAVVSGSVEECR
ncbi:ArsR/SmtB family transcription factor [Gordonia rhizosphera]|uniref:Arsenic resistance operon repressor ArsR n=1 Tax=Gordonia rhizosphera NBRC 16068 TaxID=1108045 RepID=K6WHJ4_9ACTN|nr:metalloregulator ArsR/SmtB family transcription factor [Gordonia rhizosphera]GAB93246.1 arsenic resistance operon repressor ArsR [Gordonia rhizosphera NBRC 16068]